MDKSHLYNSMVQSLINEFDRHEAPQNDKKLSVSPLVAEVATWYEKFRNAMDYREDEVILRASIDRILKRHLFFGSNESSIAHSLVRELLWARYFPSLGIQESLVTKVAETIELYLKLQDLISRRHKLSKNILNEWIMQLMSSEIAYTLRPNKEKELMGNFMFHIIKDSIILVDDSEEDRDVQTFIAVHRAFSKDDLALLRFHLFYQLFGKLTQKNLDKVADNFIEGYKKINQQLNYPHKDRIYSYTRKRTVPFLILEELFRKNRGQVRSLVANEDQLKSLIIRTCSEKYEGIIKKVQRALIRSVIFLIVTKAVFALALEGTFENIVYGQIHWSSMAINIVFPPLLMIIAAFFIKTPDRENSQRIAQRIKSLLIDPQNAFKNQLILRKNTGQYAPYLYLIFIFLWFTTLILATVAIAAILTELGFNPLSQIIFLFFLAIISFLSYRINQTAHMYYFGEEKQNLKTVLFDFLFMPFIQIGKKLTVGISKVNLFLFVFDFIIETPFKVIFAFFEEWFLYLRAQREKLD